MPLHRMLLFSFAVLSLQGLGLSPVTRAQAQDYLPPANLEPPRSIVPQHSNDVPVASSPRPAYSTSAGPSSAPPPSVNSNAAYTPRGNDNPGYGQPYSAPAATASITPDNAPPPPPGHEWGPPPPHVDTYSSNEILDAGRSFFGGASEGLAKIVEYSFQRNGRPTGYILGEEGSGAIIAGLRYGEGMLYTKGFPPQKVYWQGPSLGYDFGANGSKSFTLVYNMLSPSQIFERFAGIDGSAYLVGGVGITFQRHDDVILAPIRAGVGLRLGANVGYLKYTSSPTWNPF